MLSMQTDEFLEAIQKGNLSKVNQLLETNPALANSKAKDGTSVILLALYHGQRNIAEAITTKKTELNIFEASTLGKLVVKRGAQLNYRYEGGFSPLMGASENGNVELVNFLLANGADPTAKTKDGKTPLGLAREKNHAEVVEALKRHGAL